MADIHTYDREAADIDEIQAEDRQEKMKVEKAKAAHFKYLRHKAKTHCYKHMCDYKEEKGCPICNKLKACTDKINSEN